MHSNLEQHYKLLAAGCCSMLRGTTTTAVQAPSYTCLYTCTWPTKLLCLAAGTSMLHVWVLQLLLGVPTFHSPSYRCPERHTYVPKPFMVPSRHSPSYWLPSGHKHVPRPEGRPFLVVPMYVEPSWPTSLSTTWSMFAGAGRKGYCMSAVAAALRTSANLLYCRCSCGLLAELLQLLRNTTYDPLDTAFAPLLAAPSE